MNTPAPRTVYAVSELAEILRALVEDSLPRVWVEGEISNFSRPASGHWYFTLKDEQAQIRCAMFRNANYLVRPQPKNGDKVLMRASVSFYTARGDLQLIGEHLEPAGEGALLRAFEELKRRLLAEGLFDAAAKRPIPTLPRRIGLITSATGAAVQDVLSALGRRFPLVPVALWPVPVQGAAAAPAIAAALRRLPQRAAVDVILLVRGGGSLEDLWAFNEEVVARAIRACTVPVVCGVGHETDTTIADFAADLRAPTPTAAAELVSPDRQRLVARLDDLLLGAARALERGLVQRRERLGRALGRLAHLHPERAIRDRAQRLDDSDLRLTLAMQRLLRDQRGRFSTLAQRLDARHPAGLLSAQRSRLHALGPRLERSTKLMLGKHADRLARDMALLRSLSPQAVLDRGYAIARDASSGKVLHGPDTVGLQDDVELILARGRMRVRRAP